MSAAQLSRLVLSTYALHVAAQDLHDAARQIAGSGLIGAHASSRELHEARQLVLRALSRIEPKIDALAAEHDAAAAAADADAG